MHTDSSLKSLTQAARSTIFALRCDIPALPSQKSSSKKGPTPDIDAYGASEPIEVSNKEIEEKVRGETEQNRDTGLRGGTNRKAAMDLFQYVTTR